jgi:hypothetical protein
VCGRWVRHAEFWWKNLLKDRKGDGDTTLSWSLRRKVVKIKLLLER